MDALGLAAEQTEQAPTQAIVRSVIQQHADDAAILHATRSVLVRAGHAKLHHLLRFDNRLEAHLDGLRVAGRYAWRMCESALEAPSPSILFVGTVRAVEDGGQERLHRLFAIAAAIRARGRNARGLWLDGSA